jgi:hypothetical protein
MRSKGNGQLRPGSTGAGEVLYFTGGRHTRFLMMTKYMLIAPEINPMDIQL